jgi:hypothetical protein
VIQTTLSLLYKSRPERSCKRDGNLSATQVLGPSASRADNEEAKNDAVVDYIDLKQLIRAQGLATTETKRRTLIPSTRSIGTSDTPTNATRTAQRPHSSQRASPNPRVRHGCVTDR